MKIFTSLLFLIPCFAFGQLNTNQPLPLPFNYENMLVHSNPLVFDHFMLKAMEGTEVKKVVKTSKFNNGKKVYTASYSLNSANKPTEIIRKSSRITIHYINDTVVGKIVDTGKKTKTTQYNYVNGQLVLKESFLEDRLSGRTTYQYNEDGNIMYSAINRANKKKNYSMLYTYQDESVVQQRYMKNDKVIRLWNFNCDPAGEDVDSKVKLNVCEYKEENNDGSYIEYKREEKDGNVYLNKRYFNADGKQYKFESFLNDTQLLTESHNDGTTFYYTRYDKKGKVKYKSLTVYDDQKRLIKRSTNWGSRQKRESVVTYVYNVDGTIAEEETSYKEKITGHTSYKYTM